MKKHKPNKPMKPKKDFLFTPQMCGTTIKINPNNIEMKKSTQSTRRKLRDESHRSLEQKPRHAGGKRREIPGPARRTGYFNKNNPKCQCGHSLSIHWSAIPITNCKLINCRCTGFKKKEKSNAE